MPGGDTAITFRILGPVEAVVDGRPVDLGPPKRRLLLALLLLECGRPVSVDRLVDLTWESAPAAARRVIFAHVSRLRKALATAGPGVELATTPSGYVIRVDPAHVDAHLFRQRVAAAAKVDDPAARSRLLHAALELWRGPVLADLAPGPGPERLVRALAELRLTTLEERIEADLAAGRQAVLVNELTQLVDEHPLRERLVRHLMVALYRCGNPGEALRVYQRARADLATELGLDPGPESAALQAAILRRDPSLAAPPPPADDRSNDPTSEPGAARPDIAGPPPPADDQGDEPGVARPDIAGAPRNPVPAQLPPAAAAFTARTAELGELDAWLAGARRHTAVISAIGGTAGVGKTTLAVYWAHRVADRFPDGQLYVNLRGFDPGLPPMTPAEAIRGFLDAFGVPAAQVPAGVEAKVGLYRSLLAGKRMLVVLDNAATAEQVRPLLPGAPGCLALVTSRNRLTSLVTTEGAQPLILDVLTADESRELLVARLGPDRVAAEPDAVDAIVDRCAGLPLALAIVAARAATYPRLSLGTVAAEMHHGLARLDALDGGDRATRVRVVFSWSYRQLSPDAARLFRLLGRHGGPDIDAPAAASLSGLPVARVRPLLAELCGAHLAEEHAPGRYSRHDLLHVYAAEQLTLLEPDTERQAAHRRLLDHYLHTAYAASRLLNPHRQPITPSPPQPGVRPAHLADLGAALDWFRAERAVLVAAVERAADAGFHAHAWQLAWTCTTFFERGGHWPDLAATHLAALRAARSAADRAGQANAHYGLARAYARLDRPQDAADQFRHALDLFDHLGDRIRQARTHLGLAWILDRQDRPADALGQARQALTVARATDDPAIHANALNAVGWYHARRHDGRQALDHCRQALALQQQLGDRNGQATTWDSLGYAHHLLGEDVRAVDCYQQAIDLYRELGDRYYEADTLTHLGNAYQALGDPDAARTAWRQALDILDQLQHPEADQVRARLRARPAPNPTVPQPPEALPLIATPAT